MQNSKNKKSEGRALFFTLPIVALVIVVCAIIFEQDFINILPLLISLVVAYLQSKASRFAFLLGSLNSLIYAVIYFFLKLYAAVVSTLIFSFLLQLITYITWKKRPSGESTVFRALSKKRRIILGSLLVIVTVITCYALSLTDSDLPILDGIGSIVGMSASVAALLALVEYFPLMMLSRITEFSLYFALMLSDIKHVTFLIFAIFGLVCQIIALIKAKSLWYEQQTKNLPEALEK